MILTLLTVCRMNSPEPDDIPDPSPEELDFITDVGHAPHPRSPEQGIADMQRHLAILQAELHEWPEGSTTRAKVLADIADTRRRLAEYQSLKEQGRN